MGISAFGPAVDRVRDNSGGGRDRTVAPDSVAADWEDVFAVDLDSMERKFGAWMRRDEGRSPRPGEFLERYVTYMYDSLLAKQADDAQVTRRAKVTDTHGSTYEIDVLYEYRIAGVQHRVAIECKDTKRPIERDDVIAFCGKIQELPSTIGIFISRNGFQPSAAKYLDDHGVERMDGTQIPDFGKVVAARFTPVALPTERAVGAPFWALMECRDGEASGSWFLIPNPERGSRWRFRGRRESTVFPLFMSRRAAETFRSLTDQEDDLCVRGLEQPTLRMITSLASIDGQKFAIVKPFENAGAFEFAYEPFSAAELASEYLVDLAARGA